MKTFACFFVIYYKYLPDRQHSARFRNSKKCAISLHPTAYHNRGLQVFFLSQSVDDPGGGGLCFPPALINLSLDKVVYVCVCVCVSLAKKEKRKLCLSSSLSLFLFFLAV